MTKNTLMPFYMAALSLSFLVPTMAEADYASGFTTEYYTMVNHKVSRYDCSHEGNQIVRGQLWGSDCRPVKKYCRWGVGAGNRCLIPCESGAGDRRHLGETVKIRPRIVHGRAVYPVCKWGPHKGEEIRSVKIADVGGAVQGLHVDLFQGLCDHVVGGVCKHWVDDDDMIAEYGGHTRDTEYAEDAREAAKANVQMSVEDSGIGGSHVSF